MTPRAAAAIAALLFIALGAWAAVMVGLPGTIVAAGSVLAVLVAARRLAGKSPAAPPRPEPQAVASDKPAG